MVSIAFIICLVTLNLIGFCSQATVLHDGIAGKKMIAIVLNFIFRSLSTDVCELFPHRLFQNHNKCTVLHLFFHNPEIIKLKRQKHVPRLLCKDMTIRVYLMGYLKWDIPSMPHTRRLKVTVNPIAESSLVLSIGVYSNSTTPFYSVPE